MFFEVNRVNDWEELNVTTTTKFEDSSKHANILLTFGKPGKTPVTGYVLTKDNAKYLINHLKAAVKLAD